MKVVMYLTVMPTEALKLEWCSPEGFNASESINGSHHNLQLVDKRILKYLNCVLHYKTNKFTLFFVPTFKK